MLSRSQPTPMTDSSASGAVFCRVRGAMRKEKGRLKNLSPTVGRTSRVLFDARRAAAPPAAGQALSLDDLFAELNS